MLGIVMEYYSILFEEARKHGWGLILVRRSEFYNFINILLKRFGRIKLLDVGCWKCFLCGHLKEMYGDKIEYVGIDIVDPSGRVEGCEFYVMSATNLLFPSESFHAVVFIESLEHIQDYVQALREAYRVLKRGGGIFIQSVKAGFPDSIADQTHFHVLHPITLSRLLRWIGFQNIEYVDEHNFAVWGYKL